ncbi:hypothetical protein THAOC_09152, partial [Thalassiosira oceanica]
AFTGDLTRATRAYSTVKVAPAQMDGQGSRGEQLGKLRAEREAKAIMPGKLRAEREAKAIMKLAGRHKSQWCNLHVCDRIVRAIVRVEVFSGKPGRIELLMLLRSSGHPQSWSKRAHRVSISWCRDDDAVRAESTAGQEPTAGRVQTAGRQCIKQDEEPTAVPVEGGMKKKERTGPLTNHLKESESSEEYTAGSCRGQRSWARAPPTGGGVVGAGKCRRHADGRETVNFGPAFLSPPLNFCTHPPTPFLSFQPHKCAISGEVKTFKTANNRTFAQKCFVFSVDSDEEVIKKVQIVCELFSRVTKPYVSKTGVAGRPRVPGKITHWEC